MQRCQKVHDLRHCPVNVGSPQTKTQREQVIRIINYLIAKANYEKEASPKRLTPLSSSNKKKTSSSNKKMIATSGSDKLSIPYNNVSSDTKKAIDDNIQSTNSLLRNNNSSLPLLHSVETVNNELEHHFPSCFSPEDTSIEVEQEINLLDIGLDLDKDNNQTMEVTTTTTEVIIKIDQSRQPEVEALPIRILSDKVPVPPSSSMRSNSSPGVQNRKVAK